jgi:hypothetical protein
MSNRKQAELKIRSHYVPTAVSYVSRAVHNCRYLASLSHRGVATLRYYCFQQQRVVVRRSASRLLFRDYWYLQVFGGLRDYQTVSIRTSEKPFG